MLQFPRLNISMTLSGTSGVDQCSSPISHGTSLQRGNMQDGPGFTFGTKNLLVQHDDMRVHAQKMAHKVFTKNSGSLL